MCIYVYVREINIRISRNYWKKICKYLQLQKCPQTCFVFHTVLKIFGFCICIPCALETVDDTMRFGNFWQANIAFVLSIKSMQLSVPDKLRYLSLLIG